MNYFKVHRQVVAQRSDGGVAVDGGSGTELLGLLKRKRIGLRRRRDLGFCRLGEGEVYFLELSLGSVLQIDLCLVTPKRCHDICI